MEKKSRNIVITDSLSFKIVKTPDLELQIETEKIVSTAGIVDEKIISIQAENIPKISIGSKVSIGSPAMVYKVNSIKRRDSPSNIFDLRMARRTRSCLFILPMLPGNHSAYFYNSLLVNVFVRVPGSDENVIALLYRFSGKKEFVDFEAALSLLPNFIKAEDVSKTLVLYTFSIPEEYMEDAAKFVSGDYSKFSKHYKDRILRFYSATEKSFLGQILSKAEEKRLELESKIGEKLPKDAEVYSVPDMLDETFHPEVYDI